MMKERLKNERGITLVALVVTIIVLLILAAVSINLVLGENGIITRSKESSEVSFKKNVQEALELVIADVEISKRKDGEKAEISDLLDQGYIDNDCVININKLLGETGPYGNGTGKQDVFIIDNSELWYYDQEGQGEKISDLGDLGYLPTPLEYFEVYDEISVDEVGFGDYTNYISLKDYENYYLGMSSTHTNAPLDTYVIPKMMNEKKIEIIGHFNAPNIKNIIIPEGVLFIGISAFSDCTSLVNVKLPNSIREISSEAFLRCTSLKSINIPDNVVYIGLSAFSRCENLEHLSLKENIKNIGGSAFDRCTSLVNVELPNSVESIGEYAFYRCTSLVNIELPNSIESIGEGIFDDCTNLKTANIPTKITKIPRYMFKGCTNLESIVIPDLVTEIRYAAFAECANIESVDIPNSVTTMEERIFDGCTNLTNVKMSDNIKVINMSTFRNCSSLESITLPKNLKSVYSSAFSGCTNLTTVNYPGTEEEWNTVKIQSGNDALTNVTINFNYTE